MNKFFNIVKKSIVSVSLMVAIIGCSAQVKNTTIEKWKITDVEEYIKKSETPVIVNFWATWCKPCVEELPYFHKLVDEFKDQKVKLLLVSLDLDNFYPDKIKKFAEKNKYTAQIVWLDETDADYFCPKVDTAWSGAIPASLFVNNKTGYRKFIEEQVSEQTLRKEMEALTDKVN